MVSTYWDPVSDVGPGGSAQPVHADRGPTPGGRKVQREVIGNKLADLDAKLCQLLLDVGGYFSIENPAGSYLFLYPPIQALACDPRVLLFNFAQCAFGHQLPGADPHTYCRKKYQFTH